MRLFKYFLLGLILGAGLAVASASWAHEHSAGIEEPCTFAVLLKGGQVEAFPYGVCEEVMVQMTATAIEIAQPGQIIVLPLPFGWGVGEHTVAYQLNANVFLYDDQILPIKVRGW